MTVDLPPPVPDTQAGMRIAPSTSSVVPDHATPGELTLVWRFVVLLSWLAAFFAYAAVWQASVQLGIATWWVGPRSQQTPLLIRMIPFFISITAGILALYNVRRISHISLGFAIASVLIALPDFSRSTGLAVVEIMISGSLVVVSLGSLTGRYRLGLAESAVAQGADDQTLPNHPPGLDGAWANPGSPAPSNDTV